jgi:adenosylmethionine-8-amino-7-oxononanoate aminotransferase
MCGNSAYVWGYNYKPVVDAMHEQFSKASFVRGRLSETTDLLETVNARLLKESKMNSICWAISGSDAVEAAVELVSNYWKNVDPHKNKIVGFSPGYSGCTWIGKALRGEVKIDIVNKPLPAPYWNFENEISSEEDRCFDEIKNQLDIEPEVGAIFMESIPWLGGVRPWTNSWWKRIELLCNERNILFVIDDVAGGFGKVGSAFSHFDYNVSPDVVISGKSITGGFTPSSCVLANRKVSNVLANIEWGHGHTWQPNMIGVAATNAVLNIYNTEAVKSVGTKLYSFMNRYLVKGLIVSHRGVGSLREMILHKDFDIKELEDVDLVTNQFNRNTIGIISPIIADDEYWNTLENRLDKFFKI